MMLASVEVNEKSVSWLSSTKPWLMMPEAEHALHRGGHRHHVAVPRRPRRSGRCRPARPWSSGPVAARRRAVVLGLVAGPSTSPFSAARCGDISRVEQAVEGHGHEIPDRRRSGRGRRTSGVLGRAMNLMPGLVNMPVRARRCRCAPACPGPAAGPPRWRAAAARTPGTPGRAGTEPGSPWRHRRPGSAAVEGPGYRRAANRAAMS